MRQQFYAFCWAYGLGLLVSSVTWLGLSGVIGGTFWLYLLVFWGYTSVTGWLDAVNKFWRSMGRKQGYRAIKNNRSIPVNFGNVFESALAKRNQTKSVAMYDGFNLVSEDNDIVDWDTITRFIHIAYSRQTRGKSAFSRGYWTKQRKPVLPITHYEVILDMLLRSGYITGRRKGASGRFIKDSQQIIDSLSGKG